MIPSAAHAVQSITVETVADLQNAVSGATDDVQITLGATFPRDLPSAITLTQSTGFNVDIDGAGISLNPPATARHLVVNASAGSLTIHNLTLTQSVASATNKGIQLNQTGAANITLSEIDFRGLKSGTAFSGTPALSAGGNGTGTLTVKDSSFTGSEATFASAMRVSRSSASQQTLLQNVTFDSNVGLVGSGYSGGAMLIEAGSRGTVTINDSAFLNNELVDGGTYAHGGAVAMHNANVELHINRSYFAGNKIHSSSVSNADGGAVSAFNSTVGTNGSLFISDSTFVNNYTQDDGSAIFIEGRSAAQTDTFATRLVVSNSTFFGNTSDNAGNTDTGGAIQASLRASVFVDHSTFVRDTTGGTIGGIDIGGHLGFDGTYGLQYPKGQIVNSIVTRNLSIDTNFFSCIGTVGCDPTTVAVADEARLLTEVFGTANPAVAENRSTLVAGDLRTGKTPYPLTTVAIAPPFSPAAFTAYAKGTQATPQDYDQRVIAFATTPGVPNAGSLAMDYVRFDAATNGGAWDGISSVFPASAGTYVENPTASSGWFEVSDPNVNVPLPSVVPTAPAGMQFIGWFTEAVGGVQVDASPAAAGQTLYAQFAAVTYTVTFDSAGGSAVDPVTDVAEGATVAEPVAPTKDGFTFAGWTLLGAAYDFATPVTSDITLVATWSADAVPPNPTDPPTTTAPPVPTDQPTATTSAGGGGTNLPTTGIGSGMLLLVGLTTLLLASGAVALRTARRRTS